MHRSILALIFTTLLIPAAKAGSQFVEGKTVAASTPFDQGRLELQSASGAFFSVGSAERPTLNYSATAYRLGVMLTSPGADGWLRGNWEAMLQLFGGSIFEGAGNGLGGAALMLRYNFVQPSATWVPYIQIGGGMVYSDVHKDRTQRLIGQPWEFDLEAGFGIRYFFNDRWSANLEGGYRHISNAGLNERNVGLNSLGAAVGLGFHF